ncbi:MAG: hypothetical protein WC551_14280 [Patescibacteria group bacterium]
MDLKEQATKLMAATDPTVWLTYDEYARDRISAGAKAITVDQWDTLLAIAGKRQLQDTLVVSQITANVRTAAFGKANASNQAEAGSR